MRKNRIVLLVTIIIFMLTLPVSANLNNFQKTKNYENQFSDVTSNDWYANSVTEAYEYGLVSGNSDTTYNPEGNVTIAETIALACRLNNTYYNKNEIFTSGEKWYSPYVDYAIKNNIISANQYDNYERYATRAEFVQILSASLPDDTFSAINTIDRIPDVNNEETWAHSVYMFYRAGILSGNDLYGTFNPNSNIQRSEVATIMIRIVKPSNRRSFALKPIQTLYTADGRSQDFKLNEVEAQLAVGWYTEPMQYLYSLDGTKQLFKKSEVAQRLLAGWYEEPVTYSPTSEETAFQKLANVVIQFDNGIGIYPPEYSDSINHFRITLDEQEQRLRLSSWSFGEGNSEILLMLDIYSDGRKEANLRYYFDSNRPTYEFIEGEFSSENGLFVKTGGNEDSRLTENYIKLINVILKIYDISLKSNYNISITEFGINYNV